MLRTLTSFLTRFLRREDGPTAVEYAVLLALIIVASLTVLGSLGENMHITFDEVSEHLGPAHEH